MRRVSDRVAEKLPEHQCHGPVICQPAAQWGRATSAVRPNLFVDRLIMEGKLEQAKATALAERFSDSTPGEQLHMVRRASARSRTAVALIAGGMIAIIWISFFEHAVHDLRRERAAIAERDANLATAFSYYVERILRTASAVNNLAATSYADPKLRPTTPLLLRDRAKHNDIFAELALCLKDGSILSSRAEPLPATKDRCKLVRAGSSAVEPLRIVPQTDDRLAIIETTFVADGEVHAMVAAVSIRTLLGAVSQITLQDETAVLLTLADGTPLAAWDSRSGRFDRTGSFTPPANGVTQFDGWLFERRSLPNGLVVYVATREVDALAYYYSRRSIYLAISILVTMAAVLAVALLWRLQGRVRAQAASLAVAQRRMKTANLQLESKVQARTRQLTQANEELQAFSYSVAHDLKGPLSSIRAFADLLEPVVSGSGNPQHLHYLRRIQANASNVIELTEHLLRLGHIGAEMHSVPVDVSALALEVVSSLRERHPDRPVQVEVQPGLKAFGDRARLRQLLENLIGNAWKFTAGVEKPLIEVGAMEFEAAGTKRTFFVRDNGVGFDSDAAVGLFQPFRRLHTSSEFPGSGVGLATVRRIAAAHGGAAWCQARQGEGATFYFSLPTQPELGRDR